MKVRNIGVTLISVEVIDSAGSDADVGRVRPL